MVLDAALAVPECVTVTIVAPTASMGAKEDGSDSALGPTSRDEP